MLPQWSEPRCSFTRHRRTKIERKDDRRRRGIPAPDGADAVALAFVKPPRVPPRPVIVGPRGRSV